MSEYRVRQTGEILTQGQVRQKFKNTSLPRVWGKNVHDSLGIDPITKTPAPQTSNTFKVVVRNGFEQNSNGDWVAIWTEKDMFSDYTDEDGVTHTKAEQEAAYQAGLDEKAAEGIRTKRDQLIADTDWMALSDNTLTPAWATYRQALRDITDHVNFPYLTDADWPVAP